MQIIRFPQETQAGSFIKAVAMVAPTIAIVYEYIYVASAIEHMINESAIVFHILINNGKED